MAKTKVDKWIDEEEKNAHKVEALENASRHFDENDALTVHIIEAIYGQESSFGKYRRERNINGAAGDFQIEKQTALKYGMIVNKNNDQRFDIDNSSDVAARYLKDLDNIFTRETNLTRQIKSYAVNDCNERKKFVIAAYNAGEGRISMAQAIALLAGKNPSVWEEVKNFLNQAGATEAKKMEILDYLEKVLKYELEFQEKSKADPSVKNKSPLRLNHKEEKIGKWVTKDGKKIYI